MERGDIYRTVDRTLLLQGATWKEICQICNGAVVYSTASVCIPPSYVKRASEYPGGRMPVCTAIGFLNGYSTTAVKVFEAEDAIKNGATEVDMVISTGNLKDENYDKIADETRQAEAIYGEHILKMITKTCLLTDEEKVKMYQIVVELGTGYIKTSADFSKARATFEDTALSKEHVDGGVKIEAASGISSSDDAERFIGLGAERLGTSRIMKLAKAEEGGHGRQAADADGY